MEFKFDHNDETITTTNYGDGLDWQDELQLDVGDKDNNDNMIPKKVSNIDDTMKVEENVF